MSQITVENIKRSTETASRSTRGVAAAWVNFNGTGTVAIRDSLNVGSITDNGTGNYTANFSNSFSGSTYAGVCSGYLSAGNASFVFSSTLSSSTFNMASVYVANIAVSGDDPEVKGQFTGDLA
jgi:hypothetical protein